MTASFARRRARFTSFSAATEGALARAVRPLFIGGQAHALNQAL